MMPSQGLPGRDGSGNGRIGPPAQQHDRRAGGGEQLRLVRIDLGEPAHRVHIGRQ